MKAARLYEYNKDFDVSVRLVDVPDPEITSPSDVIVKIGGAGVCRTDLHLIEAVWQDALGDPTLPYTLGHENAGWIEEVGPAVTGLKKGDPVILHPLMTCGLCRPCRTGYDMACESGKFPGLDGPMAASRSTSRRRTGRSSSWRLAPTRCRSRRSPTPASRRTTR